jgi:hypothetical protein
MVRDNKPNDPGTRGKNSQPVEEKTARVMGKDHRSTDATSKAKDTPVDENKYLFEEGIQ